MQKFNENDKISKYFTYKEVLWCPQWKRCANESDGLSDEIIENLKVFLAQIDEIRDFFGKPIRVHCCYRPKEYNKLVKGAVNSAHIHGKAIDFDVSENCDVVRKKLEKSGLLEKLGLRMENNVGGNWVHLDNNPVPVGGNRIFNV